MSPPPSTRTATSPGSAPWPTSSTNSSEPHTPDHVPATHGASPSVTHVGDPYSPGLFADGPHLTGDAEADRLPVGTFPESHANRLCLTSSRDPQEPPFNPQTVVRASRPRPRDW